MTESQLHNIIAESVNQILCELDPRTYASAAEKRRLQGNFDASRNLKNHAVKTWNDLYGDEIDLGKGGKSEFIDVRDYDGSESLGNGEAYICNNYFDGTGDCFTPSSGDRMPFSRRGNGLNGTSKPRTKGEKVATQMIKNNGKYIKGKGWQ